MEAVPKLPLISFELKVSSDNTHFGPKLKQYIAEVYREDPESYSNEIHQLEGLRSAAVRPSIDAAGLSAAMRYFCQLRAIQSRFPMAKGQPAACNFSWKDLYANMTCQQADIRFEMASMLYNIGALHTQLGAAKSRNSADSLKAACTHFQHAAWAFLYLREQYTQPPGVDMSVEVMRLLQEICLAQAQECILEKSIQDTRKSSVIGAVATQVMYFYKNALALLGPSTGTDNIHEIIGTKLYNHWYRYLSFKMSYIGCIVCLYQGMNAEEQQKMGERVAFYQQAIDKLSEARKLAKYVEPVHDTEDALTFTYDVVQGKRKAAKNENEFIYHEEVPDKDLLLDLKPACLVKAMPINCNDPEVTGPDIFARLVPMGAHEASSMYSEEKAKLLRSIVGQAEAKTTELMEFMSSLQLDQLEVIDSEQKMPQEIVDRCAAMNAKTDVIQNLVDSMNNLAEIISDVEHSLAEIKTFIQEETLKEKEFQKVMGPRPPSIVQTELSREFHKYQEAHTRTNESNQVLHKAMTLHIANLRLLAQPLDALQTKIPSIDNIEGLDRDTMKEMRRVVGKAKEMQSQRDALIQQLREAVTSDDITSQLLARSNEPTEEIFKQELEKHTPKVKIIEQNLAAQENIINRLTSLYAAYGESRRLLSDVLRKREGLINALITSFDTYEELLGKCQKGLEFYKKLGTNVNQLLTRLRSICQVQEEERAQQLAKQTNKAATPPPAAATASAAAAAAAAPAVKLSDVTPTPASSSGTLKLKDYLPYMKNRGARSVTPQAQVDSLSSDAYYPEMMYPTSVRPTPVGSEATDMSQMKLPDGVVMPTMQPSYNRYGTPYAAQDLSAYPAQPSYVYPTTSKAYEKPEENYGHNTPYTPPQYSPQIADPQNSNPYYAGSHQNNTTTVTNSQNLPSGSNMNPAINYNQYNPNAYDPYNPHGHQIAPIPESVSSMSTYATGAQMPVGQSELNVNFGHMQIAASKSEPTGVYTGEYHQTYFNAHHPQTSTPNMATYSNAPQNSNTNMVSSQMPSDYSSLNYPYSNDPAVINQYSQGMNPNTSVGYNATNQPAMSVPNSYNTGQAINPVSNSYSVPNQPYSCSGTTYDGVAHTYGHTIFTNAESVDTSTTSVVMPHTSLGQQYNTYSTDPIPSPALSQIDSMDQPIKSHVTGEALSTNLNFQSTYPMYNQSDISISNSVDHSSVPTYAAPDQVYSTAQQPQSFQSDNSQNFQTTYAFIDQTANMNYSQTFQNHPGYSYNPTSGGYDYHYGSQSTHNTFPASSYGDSNQVSVDDQKISLANQNWSVHGMYTSAGSCDTLQSPSETMPTPAVPEQHSSNQTNNQMYYNTPYGYVTNTNQSTEVVPNTMQSSTNYGANVNQSTYMQSGQQNTNVTYSQASASKDNLPEPSNADQSTCTIQNSGDGISQNAPVDSEPEVPQKNEVGDESLPEVKSEPSALDLLSDIDFTVEQKPLMPEIKVPPISESVIKKARVLPKEEPVLKPAPKEEVIERPAKKDLVSDPSLLNKFTEEVKNLQKLVDSLSNKSVGGLTVLDAKWKFFQDSQTKENMSRSKSAAKKHTAGNIVTAVVPFDDSRLTLKSDPNAYINASCYKQLASWCIPLVISKNPFEKEYSIFWKAVLENKISCILCLLSEIEMQGKSYWPTAKGQTLDLDNNIKVMLEEVTCTVHWTERKLTVTSGKTVHNVTHYQINVFPAKIVCSPLVLLADKILSQTYNNKLSNQLTGAWIHCATGAGRSTVVALLMMVMCQVRAGQLDLCDMLDAGCLNLCKHRTNVLEDTKYLADAYRTALFYVQGVLCSGTTMFNGEAVSFQSGAAVLPPVPTLPSTTPTNPTNPINQNPKSKFSRESFEEMKQSPGLKSGDMKDPLNFLDPLWSLKKK